MIVNAELDYRYQHIFSCVMSMCDPVSRSSDVDGLHRYFGVIAAFPVQYENIDDQVASTGCMTGLLLSFPVEETAKSQLEVGGNEEVIISPSSSPPFWTLTLGRWEVCGLWVN